MKHQNLQHNQNGMGNKPQQDNIDLAPGKQLYATSIDHTSLGTFRATPTGRLVTANETLAHMFGYETPDALMNSGSSLANRLSVEPGWWDELLCILLASHDILTFESHYWRKDGSLMAGKLHTYAAHDTHGNIRYLEGFLEDMSGEAIIQPAVEPGSPVSLVQDVLEPLSDFVCITDPHGWVRYYNRAARSLLKLGEHESLSRQHINDAYPPWATDRLMNEGLPVASRDGIWSGETAILLKHGGETPAWQVVIAHHTPDGQISGFSMVARTIHEQQRAETAARCFQQTIYALMNGKGVCPDARSVGESITTGRQFVTPDTLHVVISLEQELLSPFMAVPYLATFDERPAPFYIGSRIRHMLGYSVAEWLSNEDLWLDRVCSGDHKEIRSLYAEVQKNEGPFFSIEYRIRNRDNGIVWVWDGGVVLQRSASYPLCVCGVMLDITERKRADQEFHMLYPLIKKAYSSQHNS